MWPSALRQPDKPDTRGRPAAGVPRGPGAVHRKFLYFPDENHWILTPGNARIWYETVFAFLAQHVLGEPWQRPAPL